jgi:hypothetical protein
MRTGRIPTLRAEFYTITISGTISGFRFANGGDKLKIGNVSNWGNLTITTDQAFFGCTNLTATATDAPIISTATLSYTFYGCSNFNGYVNGWDVSARVSNAERIFMLATSFNQDLNNWNTSSFTTIANMFTGASSFNGDFKWMGLKFGYNCYRIPTRDCIQ